MIMSAASLPKSALESLEKHPLKFGGIRVQCNGHVRALPAHFLCASLLRRLPQYFNRDAPGSDYGWIDEGDSGQRVPCEEKLLLNQRALGFENLSDNTRKGRASSR